MLWHVIKFRFARDTQRRERGWYRRIEGKGMREGGSVPLIQKERTVLVGIDGGVYGTVFNPRSVLMAHMWMRVSRRCRRGYL